MRWAARKRKPVARKSPTLKKRAWGTRKTNSRFPPGRANRAARIWAAQGAKQIPCLRQAGSSDASRILARRGGQARNDNECVECSMGRKSPRSGSEHGAPENAPRARREGWGTRPTVEVHRPPRQARAGLKPRPYEGQSIPTIGARRRRRIVNEGRQSGVELRLRRSPRGGPPFGLSLIHI